jgi:hypothetical protein
LATTPAVSKAPFAAPFFMPHRKHALQRGDGLLDQVDALLADAAMRDVSIPAQAIASKQPEAGALAVSSDALMHWLSHRFPAADI